MVISNDERKCFEGKVDSYFKDYVFKNEINETIKFDSFTLLREDWKKKLIYNYGGRSTGQGPLLWYFVDHGWIHAEMVYFHLPIWLEILKGKIVPCLNNAELFVLICSAYLHDSGMCANEFIVSNFLEHHDKYKVDGKLNYIRKYPKVLYFTDNIDRITINHKLIRELHPDIGAYWIIEKALNDQKISMPHDQQLAELIAKTVCLHRNKYSYFRLITNNKNCELRLGSTTYNVRLGLLSTIIAVVDSFVVGQKWVDCLADVLKQDSERLHRIKKLERLSERNCLSDDGKIELELLKKQPKHILKHRVIKQCFVQTDKLIIIPDFSENKQSIVEWCNSYIAFDEERSECQGKLLFEVKQDLEGELESAKKVSSCYFGKNIFPNDVIIAENLDNANDYEECHKYFPVYKDFEKTKKPQQKVTLTENEKEFVEILKLMKNKRSIFSDYAKDYYYNKEFKLLGCNNSLAYDDELKNHLISLLINDNYDYDLIDIDVADGKKVFKQEQTSANQNFNANIENNNLPHPYKTYLENIIEVEYSGDLDGSPYVNKPCYRLINIENSNTYFDVTSYFDYINSCEYQYYQFAKYLYTEFYDETQKDFTGIDIEKIEQRIDPFEYTNRHLVPGINTLFILLNDQNPENESIMYIHERTEYVAEAVNTKHVVPAGTFQPIHTAIDQHMRDFSFYKNIMREFGEEMIGDEELEHPEGVVEEVLERKSIEGIDYFVRENVGKVFYGGVTYDCLTLKPEILTIFVLPKNAFQKALGLQLERDGTYEGSPKAVSFNREMLIQFIRDKNMLSAGAGCMLLAYYHYDEIIKACTQ